MVEQRRKLHQELHICRLLCSWYGVWCGMLYVFHLGLFNELASPDQTSLLKGVAIVSITTDSR